MNTLYASFTDVDLAKKAGGALLDHGFKKEHLSLVANTPAPIDGDEPSDPVESAKGGVSTTTGKDAAAGAAKGGVVGAVVGAIAVVASLFIPGFGLVTGGGALATALMAGVGTAAAGAVTGGVTGYLVDQGMDQAVAQDYDKALKDGGAVIALQVDGEDSTEAQQILRKYNASRISWHTAAVPAGRVII